MCESRSACEARSASESRSEWETALACEARLALHKGKLAIWLHDMVNRPLRANSVFIYSLFFIYITTLFAPKDKIKHQHC